MARLLEEAWQIRQIGGRSGSLGGGDFSVMEYESTGHLQAIACQASDSTALHDGPHAQPPDSGAEKLEQATLAETEGPIQFTPGVGDRGNIVSAEIPGFLALLEHVDQDQSGPLGIRIPFEVLKPAQQLPGEGAAEMAQEHQYQGLLLGGRHKGSSVVEPELRGNISHWL